MRTRISQTLGRLPQIVAHRCNTLAAIRQAAAANRNQAADYLECDIRTTLDNVLVVHHDSRHLGRVIARTPFTHKSGSLLSLEAWLDAVRPSALQIHLDVKAGHKSGKWHAQADSETLFRLLQSKKMLARVVVTALPGNFLRSLRDFSPSLRLGVLYDRSYGTPFPDSARKTKAWVKQILLFHQQVNLAGVFLNRRWLGALEKKYGLLRDVVEMLHDAGIKIDVWTVNGPDQAGHFSRMGADWITTDHPLKISRQLKNSDPGRLPSAR